MKKLLILPVLLLTLLVGNPAFSADFYKGTTAYFSGDYATALREWTPLAEQGDVDAQYNLKIMKFDLVSKGIDECLFDKIKKITGSEIKKIIEKHCRRNLEKKSLNWLIRNSN